MYSYIPMENIASDLDYLKGTSIERNIRNIEDFYRDVNEKLSAFSLKEGIRCPTGCGMCCERFLPDVSKLESLYLAYNILLSERKTEIISRLNESKEQKNGPCPLYDCDNDFHCMCYDARPLICRLFASSCFPGKNGESKFAFCHLNTDFKGPDKVPADAPVMGVFGQRMICLEDNDNITEFLPLRVLKDISLIEFYSRLKK